MNHSNERLHVLVLTSDPILRGTFTRLSDELGIEAHASSVAGHASDRLTEAKYEGVLLDFDTIVDARPILRRVKESASNKNAIVFAVATERWEAERALHDQAHFLLQRPIDYVTMRHTLHTAYDLMRSERRRYFRCAALLPLQLTTLSRQLQCSTINVSSNGVAIETPEPLKLGAPVDLALSLPDGSKVRAQGVVIWDDKHGKAGLHFHCRSPEMRQKLDCWLDEQACSGNRFDV